MTRKQFSLLPFLILAMVSTLPCHVFSQDLSDLKTLLGNEAVSELFYNEIGYLVLKAVHPTSSHRDTRLTSKSEGRTDNIFTFSTNYKGWIKSHRMSWRVVLNGQGLIKDLEFLSDTNGFPSAEIANRLKGDLKLAAKEFAAKYGTHR